ncbi:MAG: ATP-binding protein [Candidatus Anammoxibacter sp.]
MANENPHNPDKIENIKNEYDALLLLFDNVQKAKRDWEQSVDCIDDIFILTDLEDSIVRCNKMLCVLTGKSYSELLNKKWQDILNEENGFKYEANDQFRKEIFHRSGEIFHFNSSPVNDVNNVVYGNIIYCHNVTILKRLEEDVHKGRQDIEKKNKELEMAYDKLKEAQAQVLHQEKMASIGQLAAGVAHEINNPIGFIMSNLNTLNKYIKKIVNFLDAQSQILKDSAESKEKDIDVVLNSVNEKRQTSKFDYIIGDIENLVKESLEGTNRVKDIVQNLKSFVHVDEKKYKWDDINLGLDATIKIVWNELKYKVTLEKEYGDIPMTKCNQGELNQVFMNILINAAQAIEEHGEITIRTWHEDSNIYISISDTGSGIPKEILKRIFDPFFTTKDVGIGTGLGLKIAYDIIKMHNGDINVDSEVGKGTTFTIRIPIVEELECREGASKQTMAQEIKILFVDDDKNVLNALKRLFVDYDYTLLFATSGDEALGILERENAQIVVADYRMPAMDGAELLKKVHERWPRTVSIMLSGHADTAISSSLINEGYICNLIKKPWNDDELKGTISDAIKHYLLV